MPNTGWAKTKRASDSRESLDARAALPQNCSIRRVPLHVILGNGTDVPATPTKVPALHRFFPQASSENLPQRVRVAMIVPGSQHRIKSPRSLRQPEARADCPTRVTVQHRQIPESSGTDTPSHVPATQAPLEPARCHAHAPYLPAGARLRLRLAPPCNSLRP